MSESFEISYGTNSTPAAALWHGGFGAIPFVALTFSAYGAVILSFLVGIQRGSAIAVDNVSLPRPGLSVTFSLIAWVVLLLPLSTWLIPVSWIGCLRLDGRSSRQPGRRGVCWYPQLRWPLTLAITMSLVLVTLLS